MRTELQNGYILKLPDRACEYKITKLLGRGASCFVYLARYTENDLVHEVILKEYNPKSLNLDRGESGALCISADCRTKFDVGMERFEQGYRKQADMRLNSDVTNSTTNIQGIHFANNTRYIEMTLSAGVAYRIDDQATDVTLYDFLRRMRSLATVIGHYHKSGYLHLDIKPDNIFAPNSNDGKDVILFDFDSMVEQTAVANISTPLSYTKEWAAMEQLNPAKRMSICKATDIFSVGEMIFYRIFGRHSNLSERRSYSTYAFDHEGDFFRNVNPKAFPLLNELLKKTLCNVVGSRYQSAEELIAKLDELIKLADPKEPYLVSSSVRPEEFFIGRDNELSAIHMHLQNSNILFLSGIGGIGKSELARNYAKIHKESGDYDTVLFATYDGSWMMLVNDDNGIHIANFERSPEEKEPDYYRRKIRKLKELCDEKTLFIIDNLNEDEFEADAKHQWKDILALGCKLLITTRLREWAYSLLEIKVFSERNSLVKLFENYCTVKSDADLAAAHEIIDYVDGHTLTVELIAKQTKAGFSTPAKMLSKLKEHGIAQSGKEKVSSIKDNEQSRATAFGHIAALFDIANLNEQEKYVLANMSLMPPSGIKAELFTEWCKLDDFDAVNSLINGGWLEQTDDVIKMHPVVSEICLARVHDFSVFSSQIKSLVTHLRERDFDVSGHKTDTAISIHLLKMISRNDFTDAVFEVLLHTIGGHFYTIHQYDMALLACEISVKIAKENNPDASYAVMESLAQAALIKAAIGEENGNTTIIREAIHIYEEAISVIGSIDTSEKPYIYAELATLYNYAGIAYEDLDEINSAREMYNKGISVYLERSELLDDDFMSLGVLYNNLANTYEHSEAVRFYITAKENHDKAGAMTRHAATTLYHLSDMYSETDSGVFNLSIAEEYALKALSYFEENYADDIYMIGELKFMLGKVHAKYRLEEHDDLARSLLLDALQIFKDFLNESNPTIQKTHELLGAIENRP